MGRVTQVDNDTRDIVVEKMTMEDVYEYFLEKLHRKMMLS